MLSLVGLQGVGRKRPTELSGGQRQRVALARALAVEPDVLLLDEPLGALDLNLRRAMQDELKEIQRRVGTTFVHVTHDQEEAMAIADRIVVMNAGPDRGSGTARTRLPPPRYPVCRSFSGRDELPARPRGAGPRRDRLWRARPPPRICPTARRSRFAPGPNICAPATGDPLGAARVTETVFQGVHRKVSVVPEAAPDMIFRAAAARRHGCQCRRHHPAGARRRAHHPAGGHMTRARPEDWWHETRLDDGITLIDEPHILPFYRCNMLACARAATATAGR